MPLAVAQVVAHSYRGEREPDVVTEEMERVAPPRVPPHADVVQDPLEVQTDLEAELALVLDRRCDSITARPPESPARTTRPLSLLPVASAVRTDYAFVTHDLGGQLEPREHTAG